MSDRSGKAQFRLNQHRPSSSLLPINPIAEELFQKSLAETKIVTVPALTLDNLFSQEKLDRVDLLKVDIQGAEQLLIRGGREALERVELILIEVLFEKFYDGCAVFGDIDRGLHEAGFKTQFLQDFRRDPKGNLLYANALYRNSHPA